MNGEAEGKVQEPDEKAAVDPWAQAFAALEQKDEKVSEDDADGGRLGGDGQPHEAEGAGGADAAPQAQDDAADVPMDQVDAGGDDPGDGEPGAAVQDFEFTEEEVTSTIKGIDEEVENQAIKDVAEAMKSSGKIRVTRQGKLGASIDDEDIYRKDEDGVPTYYNPETGRPFTGDNPRAQAKQWVEDYNKELEQAFNKLTANRIDQLKKDKEPIVRTLKFARTYKSLNDVQRDMLDSIIEDYEVKDKDGNAIGYSCDLDKALAQVNRQIDRLKARGAKVAPPKPEPTEPAVDMPASTTSAENKPPQFKNLAEAMSWQQDQLLKRRSK